MERIVLMRNAIEQLYRVENELKALQMNGKELTEDFLARTHTPAFHQVLASNDNLQSGLDFGFAIFLEAKIPVEILRASSLVGFQGHITRIDRAAINAFFLDEFGCDISRVDVVESGYIPSYAEAVAYPCGENNHYIVITSLGTTTFVSNDILVHEFGHTVEFSERRQSEDPVCILSFTLLSEAIAHYYQMAYMLKHSTKDERLSMLSSVTEAYVFYRFMETMLTLDNKARTFDFARMRQHPLYSDLNAAYRDIGLLDNLERKYEGRNFHLDYHEQHAKRLGVFLSLNIIRHKLDITELFKPKFPKGGTISLFELLQQTQLDLTLLLDFSSMDETVTDFVNGTL